MKKLVNSKEIDKIAQVFREDSTTQNDVAEAEEKALMVLYGAHKETSLDRLRQRNIFDNIFVKLSHVDPASLPPTSSAAKYHSLRAYLQVQQWQHESCTLSGEDWGWKVEVGEYIPISMDLPAAPLELLQIIRCGCQGDCSTRTCSCRKHSKECTFACSNCKGSACSNTKVVEPDDFIDEEEKTAEEEGNNPYCEPKIFSKYIHIYLLYTINILSVTFRKSVQTCNLKKNCIF